MVAEGLAAAPTPRPRASRSPTSVGLVGCSSPRAATRSLCDDAPSGRFGDKACGLLLTMANRAFGTDRSAKGRWLAHHVAEPPGRYCCPGCSSAAEEADQHADAAACGCAATWHGE